MQKHHAVPLSTQQVLDLQKAGYRLVPTGKACIHLVIHHWLTGRVDHMPVSYTHLTPPTILRFYLVLVRLSLRKKG